MKRTISTQQLFRAASMYNPDLYGAGESAKNTAHIKERGDAYKAKDGFGWRYDTLYPIIEKVLSGATVESALSAIKNLPGSGEARLKTLVFRHLNKKIGFNNCSKIERGSWSVKQTVGCVISRTTPINPHRNGA